MASAYRRTASSTLRASRAAGSSVVFNGTVYESSVGDVCIQGSGDAVFSPLASICDRVLRDRARRYCEATVGCTGLLTRELANHNAIASLQWRGWSPPSSSRPERLGLTRAACGALASASASRGAVCHRCESLPPVFTSPRSGPWRLLADSHGRVQRCARGFDPSGRW